MTENTHKEVLFDLGGASGSLLGLEVAPDIHRFAGIPYALPPGGEYRWRRPRALPDGHRYHGHGGSESPMDCRNFKPLAWQKKHPPPPRPAIASDDGPPRKSMFEAPDHGYTEDCLYLNVWMPVESEGSKKPEAGWPVFVWLHGGWLQMGDASVHPMTDPTQLLSTSGAGMQAIHVAIAYRLGVFGFLGSRELQEEGGDEGWGNYGLWDQRAGMEWVRDHIGKFGGDLNQITLAGRSAGAYAVHAQACHEFFSNPSPKPLFNRLILYSNAIPTEPKSLSDVEPQFEQLLNACGIPSSLSGKEKLTRLREMPPDKLLAALDKMSIHTFRPVSDGLFFPPNLLKRFANGDFAKEFKKRNLTLMIGECRDEQTAYRMNPPTSLETLHTHLENYYAPDVVDRLIDAYHVRKVRDKAPNDDPDPSVPYWQKVYGDIVADAQVRAPERVLLSQFEREGVPIDSVYRYRICWLPEYAKREIGPKMGVTHGADTPVFTHVTSFGVSQGEEEVMKDWIQDTGKSLKFGTIDYRDIKTLHPDGTITLEKDEKWDYLVEVGELLAGP